MNAVAITDLSINNDLDRNALAQLTGRGSTSWSFISTSTSYGSWSAQQLLSSNLIAVMNDGTQIYQEKWRRQRTEYQTNLWNKYVRV